MRTPRGRRIDALLNYINFWRCIGAFVGENTNKGKKESSFLIIFLSFLSICEYSIVVNPISIHRVKLIFFIISFDLYFRGMTHNGSGLCDGGAFKAQIFNFAQKFNRSTAVEFSSFAPLLQNPCYQLAFFG
ncbi:hypothetical protein HNQ92_003328 [Rhabdobacter roseus]|uniref:Uncharacterized protein n=1 Tax=Rhabdobacter roseus TaxID=1655419 RepID=A0A840TZ54_9BACT|nr:hypothetical protein [Rhabdobacter roseus]MBB5285180.1 hypothetical protein [Rhabdobacter roseus]